MKGVIKRKIENEQELINNMVKTFPGDKVTGVQLDSLPFEKQLHTIANTDILIGMHGAGMTMSIFLPSTSGVIELYPSYFSTSNVHFMSIAKWKKIKYTRWQNKISGNEHKNYNTYVHPSVVIDLITKTKNGICNTL
jgi:capsular polysaccharide biosynthesis protein